ncbi:hypothetical protein EK21DRAFT_88845 [Setomelanomma holmii]|uniref:Uncharacterized protein n=1 Tax=Setomelanomma holmii TaxID=210430 RepID=A0A9P4HAI3_9PLEO|nr:hypothetical protein EK21DRAFT_88845 [Setomelanomma holmii]
MAMASSCTTPLSGHLTSRARKPAGLRQKGLRERASARKSRSDAACRLPDKLTRDEADRSEDVKRCRDATGRARALVDGPTCAKVVSTWEACPQEPGPKGYVVAALALASRGVRVSWQQNAKLLPVTIDLPATASSLISGGHHAMDQGCYCLHSA